MFNEASSSLCSSKEKYPPLPALALATPLHGVRSSYYYFECELVGWGAGFEGNALLVEAVLCFVAALHVGGGAGTLLAPRCFNEDLINMFLVCTKAFVFSHTRRAKARVPDMHIRQRQQLTSFLFFPPDFSLSLYICILLKILKNKLYFSSGAGWKEFEFIKQLVSLFQDHSTFWSRFLFSKMSEKWGLIWNNFEL